MTRLTQTKQPHLTENKLYECISEREFWNIHLSRREIAMEMTGGWEWLWVRSRFGKVVAGEFGVICGPCERRLWHVMEKLCQALGRGTLRVGRAIATEIEKNFGNQRVLSSRQVAIWIRIDDKNRWNFFLFEKGLCVDHAVSRKIYSDWSWGDDLRNDVGGWI